MNTVTVQKDKLEVGSILQDENDGEFYILARVSKDGYAAIGLANGNRYIDPQSTLELAKDDLQFVGNKTITVK